MRFITTYKSKKELELEKIFFKQGYIIGNIKDKSLFKNYEKEFLKIVSQVSKISKNKLVLENFHKLIPPSKINDIRVNIFKKFNKNKWLLPTYYYFAKEILDIIVGNEICIQKQINLSIQMPNDQSSMLSIHADSFNGESPYQVVLWIPIVNAYKTNSMFILNPNDNKKLINEMKQFKQKEGLIKIYKKYEKKFKFLNVKKGQYVIFSSNLLHGNTINKEKHSRWSFNTRVKSLFSPYNSFEKSIGNFYQPKLIKPATICGLNFDKPE